jgi:hypothetical protein
MNYLKYTSLIFLAALLPTLTLAQQQQDAPGSLSQTTETQSQQIASSDTAAVSTPSPAVSNDGILSCNQTAAYGQSVGAFSARASVYVPVSDSAVTLNTGYLVYVACQLRRHYQPNFT